MSRLTYWLTPGEIEITEAGNTVSPMLLSTTKRVTAGNLIKQCYFWENPPRDPLLLAAHDSHDLERANMFIERGGNRATAEWIAGRWGWYPIWLVSDEPWPWPTPGLRLDHSKSVEIFEVMPDISLKGQNEDPERWPFIERVSVSMGCSKGGTFLWENAIKGFRARRSAQIKFGGQWVELQGHEPSAIRVDADSGRDLRSCLRELFERAQA